MDLGLLCWSREGHCHPVESESQKHPSYRMGYGGSLSQETSLQERFFRFIFLERSWATDRANLTRALRQLGRDAKADSGKDESSPLVSKGREPLWLLIFPEGTITSDEERAKSVRYATKEGIVSTANRGPGLHPQADFKTTLHPRSTGLLFCLRALLPEISDLQVLDLTIGYPGVPFGKYPQEWYVTCPLVR